MTIRSKRTRIAFAITGLLGLALSACSEPREGEAGTVTWQTEVEPLVASSCAVSGCHAGADPAGGYALESYLGALGTGSDEVPNAVAGDPQSRILTVLDEAGHAGVLDEAGRDLLTSWVVDDDLAYFYSAVHPAGILNPHDGAFHGALVAEEGWTMDSCRACHGFDYAGGDVDVSCNGCHTGTPEACDTCHGEGALGAPPPTLAGASAGAHAIHLAGSDIAEPVACETCHQVPETFDAPGHVDGDGHADVALGGLARAGGATPHFDVATGTCSGTYCHGALAGGLDPEPSWTQDGLEGGCAACHGLPPSRTLEGASHPLVDACFRCHGNTVDGDNQIVAPANHLNGRVN